MNGKAFAIIDNKTKEVVEIRMTLDEANIAKNYRSRVEGSSFSVKACTWVIEN